MTERYIVGKFRLYREPIDGAHGETFYLGPFSDVDEAMEAALQTFAGLGWDDYLLFSATVWDNISLKRLVELTPSVLTMPDPVWNIHFDDFETESEAIRFKLRWCGA